MNKFFLCKIDPYDFVLSVIKQENITDTSFENIMRYINHNMGIIRIVIGNDTICVDKISENSSSYKIVIEQNWIPEELANYAN